MAETNHALVWDADGEKTYETGVKKVALYVQDSTATSTNGYAIGVAWNGITSINESPSGAESTPLYADDIKYLNLVSAEEFGYSIEAYTYPDEFMECDGSATLTPGMYIGQQDRRKFCVVYQTTFGNDTEGNSHGFKLHIVYSGTAAPSEKGYQTINDSPDAIQFSWEVKTTPVVVPKIGNKEFKPTATVTIDSTDFTTSEAKTKLETLMGYLYGDATHEPQILMPAQIYTILTTGSLS